MDDDLPASEFDSPEEAREHARQLIKNFRKDFKRSDYNNVELVLFAFNCAVDFEIPIPRWVAHCQAVINRKIIEIQQRNGDVDDKRVKAEAIYSEVFRFDKIRTRQNDREFDYLVWGAEIEDWRDNNRRKSGKKESYAQAYRELFIESDDPTVTMRFLKEAHQFYQRWTKKHPGVWKA